MEGTNYRQFSCSRTEETRFQFASIDFAQPFNGTPTTKHRQHKHFRNNSRFYTFELYARIHVGTFSRLCWKKEDRMDCIGN